MLEWRRAKVDLLKTIWTPRQRRKIPGGRAAVGYQRVEDNAFHRSHRLAAVCGKCFRSAMRPRIAFILSETHLHTTR
jgi:hypothetical protein